MQQNSWKISILLVYYYQLFSWDQERDTMSLILFLLYVQQIKAKLSELKGAKKKKLLFFSNSIIIYAENPNESYIKLFKLTNNLNMDGYDANINQK